VATTEQTGGQTVVSAWVPLGTARDLRALATREDRSVSRELRRAIDAHLALEDALRGDGRERRRG
jgi:hypothetical protein